MALKLPFQVPHINLHPRVRKILRIVGITLFALLTFVFALQASFPYERATNKAIEAAADKYDISIGSVERGWMPGRVYFKAVTVRTRQSRPDEVATTFYIEKLEVDLGILPLIGGKISVDFDAKIGIGHLAGNVSVGKFGRGDIAADITGTDFPGANLPMMAVVGLPISGKIEAAVDLDLPMEKSKLGRTAINWQHVRGSIALACPSGCTFGDGHTKMKPLLKNKGQQAMVGEGLDLGKINVDSLDAKVTIKSGKLTLDKLDTKSKDGELHVDYMMTLEKDFGDSMVSGCLRFKGSDDLMRREPKTHAAISTTGAELRSDGLFHIKLSERFKEMRRTNAECGPNAKGGAAGTENFSGDRRPNLTVQPADEVRPTNPTIPPPPPLAPTQPEQMPATPPAHDAGVTAPTGSGSAAAGSAEPPTMPSRERPTGSSAEPPNEATP